jgi:hypothetical protein
MRAPVEFNGGEFLAFAPQLTFNGVPFFSEIRCAKKDNKFYRVKIGFAHAYGGLENLS